MMYKIVLVAAALLLAGCGSHNNPSPPPPPPPPPPPGPSSSVILGPSSPWVVTEAGAPAPTISAGVLSLNASSNWVSYAMVPYSVALNPATTATLTYTVSGSGQFVCNNSGCHGARPTIRILLQRAGDNLSCAGAFNYYREFSQPFGLLDEPGTHTLSVPLSDPAQWTPCTPPNDAGSFAGTLRNIGLLGVCFGGGDFACHGISANGDAQLTINRLAFE